MQLRPYQTEAIQSFFDWCSRDQSGNPLIVAPTGSGKSLIIAGIIRQLIDGWEDIRICALVDSRELIAQNAATMAKLLPGASIGIYSAGMGRRELDRKITFAGIQSIYYRAFEIGKIDVIIIDEAHMIPRESATRYGQFIKDAKYANPNVVILGLTATPYRLDSGLLYDGDDALFSGVCYECSIQDMIADGYLVPLTARDTENKINLKQVHTRMGEFIPSELENAANDDEFISSAIDEIITLGNNRKAWLIFCAGVTHAENVCRLMAERGVNCEIITGTTDPHKRDDIIARFKSGEIRAIINVAVLIKGFDAPNIDLIALLTATKSTGRYVQMLGRGTRPAPGKENCLVLDFGGNVVRHGPFDSVKPTEPPKDGEGAAPIKTCPNCSEIIHASYKTCPNCGYIFPEQPIEATHDSTSYSGNVMASKDPEWVELSRRPTYERWPGKNGKPDTLRMTFYPKGMRFPISMWIAPEHGGYASQKAFQTIAALGGTARTVSDALAECDNWIAPTRLKIIPDPKNPKFYKILSMDIPEEQKKLI